MSAEHVVNVRLIVTPVNDSASIDGCVIIVSAQEQDFSSSLADGEVWAEVHEVVLEGSQAGLQQASEVCVVAVAIRFMPDHYDAELGGMCDDVVAQLPHDGIEVEACLQTAMIDGQVAAIHCGTQVEETDTQRQHLLHGLRLDFSSECSYNSTS